MAEYVVALQGGDASGAWFEGHALPEPPPATVEIAIGGEAGPALLDLPDDELELGERLERYAFKSIAIICTRGRRGCCQRVATYVPEGLAQAPERSKRFRRLLEDAGVAPALRSVDG